MSGCRVEGCSEPSPRLQWKHPCTDDDRMDHVGGIAEPKNGPKPAGATTSVVYPVVRGFRSRSLIARREQAVVPVVTSVDNTTSACLPVAEEDEPSTEVAKPVDGFVDTEIGGVLD